MRLWTDPSRCRGCLRCELACSYHHSGHQSFCPSTSSTTVSRSNDDRTTSITIDSTCDLCRSEPWRLCVRACVFGARGVVG